MPNKCKKCDKRKDQVCTFYNGLIWYLFPEVCEYKLSKKQKWEAKKNEGKD